MSAAAHGEGFFQVGKGARLTGRLAGRGAGVIHGEVQGVLELDGDLLVPTGGRFRFKAGRCQRLHLEGQGGGRLKVTGDAALATGSRFEGDLHAQTFEGAAGFAVEGEVRIAPPGRDAAAGRTDPLSGG
ncbi:MAG TPA: hypothetical protein ENK10_01150 [Acidobacteria bacterium]|nr:hypothetical protein [Acidobacteriota bacterium]